MSKVLHIVNGEKLKVIDNQLVVIKENQKYKIDLDYIECIVIETLQCSLTISSILLCSEHKIPLIVCNKKHQPEVFCHNLYSYYKLTENINKQIKWLDNEDLKGVFKNIIYRKIIHQGDLLKDIGHLLEADKLYGYGEELLDVENKNKLDNLEAVSARIYFKSLFGNGFLRSDESYINSGLNYGYMVLRALIMTIIVSKGYHPSIGIWHHSQLNNYNLADDLLEIYRPMIDFVVYFTISKGDDFDKDVRNKLLQILVQNVEFQEKKVSLRQSIEKFIDSISERIDNGNDIEVPKVRIDYYEY